MSEKSKFETILDWFDSIDESALDPHVVKGSLRLTISNCPANVSADIARTLVEERLAACVNVISGVTSYYSWEHELHVADEHTLLIKSPTSKIDDLAERLVALHPDDTPEVLVFAPHAVSANYRQWALEATQ